MKSLLPYALSLLVAAPAHALALPQQIDQEQRLKEIEAQLENNTRNAEEMKQIVPLREQELAGLRARLIESADSLKEAETSATRIERRLEDLETEALLVQQDLDTRQREISDILAALQSLERSKPPALAVSPGDAAKAARAAMTLSGTVPDLQVKVDELQSVIDRNALLQRQMRDERTTLLQSYDELDARSQILEDQFQQKQREFQEVNDTLARLEEENTRLAREATSIRELLLRLNERANAEDALPVPRLRPSANTPAISGESLARRPDLNIYNELPRQFSAARGKLPLPVSGRMTRKFGSQADGEALEGLRIETRGGAIVTSPFNGKVVFAESLGRLGNVFILDVGENYHVIMMGIASLEVSAGEQINAGEPIGYMSDANEREELHFEIRRNREPLDPAKWFTGSLTG
ncbi:murein hydrolase activator EnvC [Parvularcula sp. IMCC14364]|uniref:murein hydrolase activator EnvC family protein n=1 Tax=Parvularcula sp. IMCC14364 TaxID=3067902 RepID=UPI002741EBDE|nr:peptidoglycan DD-metalloendopeptidase family protein [Parvularcula sp. IMCC14364]